MTPERLAEIERKARSAVFHNDPDCDHCDAARVQLELLAHIRDLEAQVREAREKAEPQARPGWHAFDEACTCSLCRSRAAHLNGCTCVLCFIKRNGHTNDANGDPCNYFMRFHEKSRYVCTCGYEELLNQLATATPPSPEVGA